jgi:DnaJ-class molecular chaperone
MSLRQPLKECPSCLGDGYKIEKNPDPTGDRWIRVSCLRCKGKGYVRE